MSSNAKIIGGILAGAGVASYLLFTKHGKELTEQLAENSKSFFNDAKEKVEDSHEDLRNSVANKVFDFATDHRNEIASLASAVVPILLKTFVKNKI